VPEQAEPEQPRSHRHTKSLEEDLAAHDQDPDQADADMGAVGADQGEEGREKSAAVGAGAQRDQADELAALEEDEARAQHEGHQQPSQHGRPVALPRRQRGKAEGGAAHQQERGLERGVGQAEQRLGNRAARGVARHDAVGHEQQAEDHRVAHQVEPEAERALVVGVRRLRIVMARHG